MGNRVDHSIPRLTAKPLPETEAAWRNEVLGIARFLLRAIDMDTGDPYDWAQKIAVAYIVRIADLQLHKPQKPRGRPRRVRLPE